MRTIYTIFFYVALPFIVLRLYIRGKKNPEYRKRISERLGNYKSIKPQPCDIWLHAVSLGEAIAATALIHRLAKDYKLVVTCTTPTGSAYIQKQFKHEVQHVYLPYDIGLAIKSFIRNFQPKKLITMETEIWPNILYYTAKYNIPSSIINGRISDGSVKQYMKFKNFFAPFMRRLNWIGAQSKEDKQRFIDLGSDPRHTTVMANIKFAAKLSKEIKPDIISKTEIGLANREAWVAGSTHAEEDIQVIAAHQEILQKYPNALLILVPRHLDRKDAIIHYAKQNNLKIQCSSTDTLTAYTNIWLVDQMGVLQEYYKLTPIAFVGGSLVPIGGHNLLEPARAGAVVISGNELHNFKQIRNELLSCKALEIIHDKNALAQQVLNFIENPELRTATQQRGTEFLNQQSAAVLKPILDWAAH